MDNKNTLSKQIALNESIMKEYSSFKDIAEKMVENPSSQMVEAMENSTSSIMAKAMENSASSIMAKAMESTPTAIIEKIIANSPTSKIANAQSVLNNGLFQKAYSINPIIDRIIKMQGLNSVIYDKSIIPNLPVLKYYNNQIKYLHDISPDLSIRTEKKKTVITDNKEIEFDIKQISDVVGLKRTFEELSIEECSKFVEFLSEYPYLSLKNPIGQKIFENISQFSKINIDNIILYRVRKMENRKTLPYVYREMFQPQFRDTFQGRFSGLGLNYLYFSDSSNAAVEETISSGERCTLLTVRLIKIKQILDITDENKPIFQYCHFPSGNIAEKLSIEYLFPNYVSDCAKYLGFDGIKYRSVQSAGAINYVFFNAGIDSFEKKDIQKVNK